MKWQKTDNTFFLTFVSIYRKSFKLFLFLVFLFTWNVWLEHQLCTDKKPIHKVQKWTNHSVLLQSMYHRDIPKMFGPIYKLQNPKHGEEQHEHKHIHSNVWLRGRFRLVYGNAALSLIRPALRSLCARGATCLEVKWIAPLKFDGERGHGSMRYLSSKQTVTKGPAKRWKARHGCTYKKKTKKNLNFTHSTSSKQNPPV